MCDLCRGMDHGTDTVVHRWWPSPCVRFPHDLSPRYCCPVPISPKKVSSAGVDFASARQSWADAIDGHRDSRASRTFRGLANPGAFRGVMGSDIERVRPFDHSGSSPPTLGHTALATTPTLHSRTQLAIDGGGRDHAINGPVSAEESVGKPEQSHAS
jgi:hypothetical protein